MKNIDLNVHNYDEYIKKNCDNSEWTEFMLNLNKQNSLNETDM